MKQTLTKRIVAAAAIAGCATLIAGAAHADKINGYLYTSLNGEATNQVIAIERYAGGRLGKQVAYPTGSKGGANRAAGGDAAGDFDSQGAIQIIGDYLLVVNAGGNTISVFDLDRKTGKLAKRVNVASGGTRPVSIANVPKAGASGQHWVVVGNQWNNPNVQKGGKGEGPIEMYPDAAFHAAGGGHTANLADRNVYLFSFDERTGSLTPERSLDSYVGTHGGPATVAFNADGSKLAVSTWGIAHFATETPTRQKPSRVYVYDFDRKSGAASNVRFFEQKGVAGSIGFSWHDKTSTLFVSNFNLVPETRDHSLTVLRDDGKSVRKIGNFGTGEGADIDEACWTILDASGRRLYVSSFGGNLISVFDVADNGSVKPIGNRSETVYARRKDGTPPGDTKDMYITSDGRYLFNLGAYQTFTVSSFDIDDNGTLRLNEEYKVQAATEKGPGAYNFLGLTGIDM
ncbi:MAG: lactonase family protein [Gammaproteobacteria bacterium]|nr:lactonase family protein [Gammaproteobacteria bacterium]